MGRFWLGISLLLLFLGLGLWTGSVAGQANEAISQTLAQAADTILSGDLETGKQLAQQARQDWENQWHSIATVADHSPMDEIDSLFGQMSVYAQAGQSTALAACCARLSRLIAAVGEAHSLTWWNLL